ncbi:subtilisin-like protease [Raphidocelis subcapitata]|uniref:Subtilisin-like protease n=1 Tax=Raphidocelis subcapitata TaxID=307507 RepID=A0A2V0NR29_9CHLO|nr:subtilisin-like protease [Raphidocelis subcapitata]|eukprot:GBF88010.1 subtilisin-like protease [Raphidocelis subcapitata]
MLIGHALGAEDAQRGDYIVLLESAPLASRESFRSSLRASRAQRRDGDGSEAMAAVAGAFAGGDAAFEDDADLLQSHIATFEAVVGAGAGQRAGPEDGSRAAAAAAASDGGGGEAGPPGGPSITHHYTAALNGFAAAGLSPSQAADLSGQPGVRSVARARAVEVTTYSTPGFLGLSGKGQLWDKAFKGPANAGRVLIGVIDSGIDPRHPSFGAAPSGSGPLPSPGPGPGACGEPGTCTAGKLLACRSFSAGQVASGRCPLDPADLATCTDSFGHGTPSASIAAGKSVPAYFEGISRGNMSGMAPGAMVAAYKVFWKCGESGALVGVDTDVLAAIDAAVKDGVDVLNLSLAGKYATAYTWEDSMIDALRGAASAGVFVSVAAGNAPLGCLTSAAPWVATVAGGTHARPWDTDDTRSDSPQWWGGSCAGPAPADGYAMLKPDVMAPAAGVFAAMPSKVVPGGDSGKHLSGTSFAAPHVSGIAALLMDAHRDWSPAAVKSALMTTARTVTAGGKPLRGNPFLFGAGAVDATAAMDPGLLYDLSPAEYDLYVCTATQKGAWSKRYTQSKNAAPRRPDACAALCGGGGEGGPCAYPQGLRDFNLPSFMLPGLRPGRGAASAARTVTYVGAPGGARFTARLQLPAGFAGAVAPAELAFSKPGDTAAFTLTVEAEKGLNLQKGSWHFGELVWVDAGGRYSVRSPVVLGYGRTPKPPRPEKSTAG